MQETNSCVRLLLSVKQTLFISPTHQTLNKIRVANDSSVAFRNGTSFILAPLPLKDRSVISVKSKLMMALYLSLGCKGFIHDSIEAVVFWLLIFSAEKRLLFINGATKPRARKLIGICAGVRAPQAAECNSDCLI